MDTIAAFVLACMLAPTSPSAERAPVSLAQLPVAFIENRGQVDARAHFYARRGGMTAYFTENAFVFQLARGNEDLCATRSTARSDEPIGANIFLTFEGTCDETVVEGIHELPGRSHYFHGHDP